MLSLMFNAMLTHGFNPEYLLLSTIISIPKDNRGSMNSSDISICKLYDYVFIDLNMDYLKTDDMQFGFKNNHSPVLCTAVYIETINHYMNEGSDVHSCLIDAAKLLTESTGGIKIKIKMLLMSLMTCINAPTICCQIPLLLSVALYPIYLIVFCQMW